MGIDIIARSVAAGARTNANLALAKAGAGSPFTGIGSLTTDPQVATFASTGYASHGLGAGTYVADSLATSALAAAHPRFCKATANGRYFRLVPDASGAIGVAQGGAAGTSGQNDQPAIQAAVNYAAAVGIATVRLLPRHESWQPAFPGGSPDSMGGYHLIMGGNVALVGAEGGTVLSLKNPTGAARTRNDATGAWGSGWMMLYGSGITRSVLRNLKVDGGTAFTNVLANGEANVGDKGIAMFEINVPNLALVDHRDVEICNFAGELWYMGGTYASTMIHLERVKLHHSPQSALNTGTLSKMIAIAVECGDSYQPAEVLAKDHLYIGCRFYNGYNISFMFTESFSSGYFYSYPFFTDTVPKWLTFEGTRFENITDLRFGARTRGRIVTVDCGVLLQGDGKLCDVSLDIEAWADRANNIPAMTFAAPVSLTAQVPNCPVGTYYQKPRNINVTLTVRRTETAIANNWNFSRGVEVYGGFYDSNSCTVRVRGALHAYGVALSTINPYIGPASGATLPRIMWDSSENPAGADRLAFISAGDFSVDNVLTGLAIVPTGGVQTMTLTNTNNYTFAHGQRLRVINATGAPQGTTRQIRMPGSGAGMLLKETRTLYYGGDYVDLEWDGAQSAWVEAGYFTRQQLALTSSATYDAPSIAAGGSATTTVTVSGASLGDMVSGISLGVDTQGLDISGYVSAANTATVLLRNPTAAAVDLASTTLSVRVTRK